MRLSFVLFVLAFAFAFSYASVCTDECQAQYSDFVNGQKTFVGHWGAAEDSSFRCPDNVMAPADKCPSDFFTCRGTCDNSNWDKCITICWDSLQNCCLDNAMSNAEALRSDCMTKCTNISDTATADSFADKFKNTSAFGVQGGVCGPAALILFVLAGYAFVHRK